jgi:hypothetical protein
MGTACGPSFLLQPFQPAGRHRKYQKMELYKMDWEGCSMKRTPMVILLTAAGILAASAVVGASGLSKKVSGLLRNDVKVVVSGTVTGLTPVFINGKAYLPAREAAAELGYELDWRGKEKVMFLEEKSQIMHNSGVISGVTAMSGGEVSFDFMGRSMNGFDGRIIFKANAHSVLTDEEGKSVGLEALQSGVRVTVEYGPAVLTSNPPQAYVRKLTVGQQRLIREDVIREANVADGDARIVFGTGEGDKYAADLVLNLGKETSVVKADGQSVPWSSLKTGMKVRAYYGPLLLQSMPLQSPADTIVILDETTGK